MALKRSKRQLANDDSRPPGPPLSFYAVLRPVSDQNLRPIKLNRVRVVIGRDPEADYWLSGPTVSWHHARVTHQENDLLLEDLESANGTFVDGVPILACVLRDGDEIRIGSNRFYLDRFCTAGVRDS